MQFLRARYAVAGLLLAGCSANENERLPGDSADMQPYSGIAETEVLHLTGTEPFWGGSIANGTLTYSTPENIEGTAIAVTRFAGRGGVSFSGELEGAPLDLAITPGECSDGMSDRTYPLHATLQIGSEQRVGCAYRDEDDLGPPP
jgi:uncharacterized membrane protein